MPSKNEETKLQTDPSDQQNKILSELQQLPLPPLQPAAEPQKLNPLENRRDDSDSITAVAARDPITTSPSLDSIINDFENSLSFLDYDPILNPGGEEFDDDEDEDEELRSYDAEEGFFHKISKSEVYNSRL